MEWSGPVQPPVAPAAAFIVFVRGSFFFSFIFFRRFFLLLFYIHFFAADFATHRAKSAIFALHQTIFVWNALGCTVVVAIKQSSKEEKWLVGCRVTWRTTVCRSAELLFEKTEFVWAVGVNTIRMTLFSLLLLFLWFSYYACSVLH